MSTIAIIGGTGLLGRATAEELQSHGHEVMSIALPPRTAAPVDGVRYEYLDIATATDAELRDLLAGVHGVVYAAGADERTTPAIPAAAFFYRANVLPTQRMVRLSRLAGATRFVLFGSYFSHFAEQWTDLHLSDVAGYPRTRLLQEQVAYLEGDPGMSVSTLRLPWIFGTMPGVVPLWSAFVQQVAATPVDQPIYVPVGSTTAITTRQVAQAARGALERGEHGKGYVVAGIDLTYAEFHRMIADALNIDRSRIQPVPVDVFKPAMVAMDAQELDRGLEHGIHLADVAEIQGRDATTHPGAVRDALGYAEDDVLGAVRESLRVCVDALKPEAAS
jgi:nucleoside-diphosphate-sugar epimerase